MSCCRKSGDGCNGKKLADGMAMLVHQPVTDEVLAELEFQFGPDNDYSFYLRLTSAAECKAAAEQFRAAAEHIEQLINGSTQTEG